LSLPRPESILPFHRTIQPSIISGNTATGGLGGNAGNGYNGSKATPSYHGQTNPGYSGYGGYAGGRGGNAAGGGVQSTGGTLYIQTSIISGNVVLAGSGGNGGNGGKGGAGSLGGTYNHISYVAGLGGDGGNGGNGGNSGAATGAGISSGGLAMNSYDILTIKTSTISGNTANGGKGGLAGAGGAAGTGGSYTYNGTHVVAQKGSAGYAGNSVSSSGGGIYSSYSNLALSQVTVAGNTAGNGGGVAIFQDPVASIHNSTIALNKARVSGGGLFVTLDTVPDPVYVVSTIIARNSVTLSKSGAPDVSGEITAAFTLIGNQTGAIVDSDINSDPNFLQSFGGTTGTLGLHDGGVTGTLLATTNTPQVTNNSYSNPDSLTADQNGVTISSTFFIGAVNTTT
jgi:hypothetical protein